MSQISGNCKACGITNLNKRGKVYTVLSITMITISLVLIAITPLIENIFTYITVIGISVGFLVLATIMIALRTRETSK